MNRKPIFDAVRAILGRGFTQKEVERIDAAIDHAVAPDSGAVPRRLGTLSERFESGGRGPGAVSGGGDDPGGVSYGIYQLSSRVGTAARFVEGEGALWKAELSGVPGSPAFSAGWRAIADREPEAFADAQHAFIERTHYRPVVDAVYEKSGLDLDSRHPAVRNAAWSVAVQHAGAARILSAAVAETDAAVKRTDASYDRRLIETIYKRRTNYVLRVAERFGSAARRTLHAVTRNRYPAELRAALAMFGERAASG